MKSCKLRKKIHLLFLKLYEYKATLEFFINGKLEEMKRYSTIYRYPEILYTIEEIRLAIPDKKIRRIGLGSQWIKDDNKCYIVEFIANLSDMETYVSRDYDSIYKSYSEVFEVNGYDYDYDYEKIPNNFFNNLKLIEWFLYIYLNDGEEYGSLLPNKYIDRKYIKIINVD